MCYDSDDIYNFHISLKASPLVILAGTSGVGKTRLPLAYAECINLTGNFVCGPNVTNMRFTYRNCHSLTGNPVCGEHVKDMHGTYENCISLNK